MSTRRNLPTCAVCEKPMRPRHTSITNYPNTVLRGSATLCWNHMRDEAPKTHPMQPPESRLFANSPEDKATVRALAERRCVGSELEQVLGALGLAS